jgi:hypothetical protein
VPDPVLFHATGCTWASCEAVATTPSLTAAATDSISAANSFVALASLVQAEKLVDKVATAQLLGEKFSLWSTQATPEMIEKSTCISSVIASIDSAKFPLVVRSAERTSGGSAQRVRQHYNTSLRLAYTSSPHDALVLL